MEIPVPRRVYPIACAWRVFFTQTRLTRRHSAGYRQPVKRMYALLFSPAGLSNGSTAFYHSKPFPAIKTKAEESRFFRLCFDAYGDYLLERVELRSGMLGSMDSTGGMDRPLSETSEETFCEVVFDAAEPAEEAFEELLESAPSEQPVKTAAVIAARTAKSTMPLVGFFMLISLLILFRNTGNFLQKCTALAAKLS